MKKEKLVVIVSGGGVQAVFSSSLEYPIEVEVLNYDDYKGLQEDDRELELEEFHNLEEEIKDYYPIY